MKGIIALLMIGICLQSSWARPFETDCGEEGGSLSHLIAKIPVIGRRLLEKKSCSEAPFTKVLGIYVKKESIYDTFSECCSSCLKVDTCVAWSFNEHAKACKVYDKDGQFYQTTAKHHTSGILTSRLYVFVFKFEHHILVPPVAISHRCFLIFLMQRRSHYAWKR